MAAADDMLRIKNICQSPVIINNNEQPFKYGVSARQSYSSCGAPPGV